MPKKPNYNFEKQKKERDRLAKQNAKREEKLRRQNESELPPPQPPAIDVT